MKDLTFWEETKWLRKCSNLKYDQKNCKCEPFRAQLQKIKQLITYYKSVTSVTRKGTICNGSSREQTYN